MSKPFPKPFIPQTPAVPGSRELGNGEGKWGGMGCIWLDMILPGLRVSYHPAPPGTSWQSPVSLYKIVFHFEAFVHESIILLNPPPICTARTIAMLLHVHCAIYDAPPTLLVYAIHHTILAMAISCKGQSERLVGEAAAAEDTRRGGRHRPRVNRCPG